MNIRPDTYAIHKASSRIHKIIGVGDLVFPGTTGTQRVVISKDDLTGELYVREIKHFQDCFREAGNGHQA